MRSPCRERAKRKKTRQSLRSGGGTEVTKPRRRHEEEERKEEAGRVWTRRWPAADGWFDWCLVETHGDEQVQPYRRQDRQTESFGRRRR